MKVEPRARTFDVVTVVWGSEFRQLFLDVCMPNQLTPGNLGALPAGSRYRVFTSREDVDALESSSALQQVNAHMPVDIVVMPELSASSRSRFRRLTACHHRSVMEARESRSALIFLCPDHMMSEGTLAAVVQRHKSGSRAVVCTGIRVIREPFLAALHARGDGRAVSPRDMVSAALDHLHPFTYEHMIGAPCSTNRPIAVYWKVPGEGILARCFYLHPLMVDPLLREVPPEGTIDQHYVRRSCPRREDIHVVSDSDELVVFEMSPTGASAPDPGGLSPWRAATTMGYCDSHQQSYWHEPIRLHVRDIGEAWAPVEEKSSRFAKRTTRIHIVRRWLKLRPLKVLGKRGDGLFRKYLCRGAKGFVAQARRSAALMTHSVARRGQRFRKRAERAGRRVLRRARLAH